MNHSVAIAYTLFSRILRDKIQNPMTLAELLEMYPQLKDKFPNYSLPAVGKALTTALRRHNIARGSIQVIPRKGYDTKYMAVGV